MSPRHARAGRLSKVFCGTWNMGNAQGEDMHFFLPDKSQDYDIIAIGLQESTYTVGEEGKDGHENSEGCVKHLSIELAAIIGNGYFVVEHARRAQMQLIIYAKASLRKVITKIEKSAENTGFLHIFPNKGGLCVCFNLFGTKLAFISCHLAAHEGAKNCANRNSSVKEILGGTRAGDSKYDVTVQFHHTFFMGDLNYRLDSFMHTSAHTPSLSRKDSMVGIAEDSVEREKENGRVKEIGKEKEKKKDREGIKEKDKKKDTDSEKEKDAGDGEGTPTVENASFRSLVMTLISHEKWSDLLQYDELNRELLAGNLLPGFTAAMPSFPPTFKRSRHLHIPKLLNTDLIEKPYTTKDVIPPQGYEYNLVRSEGFSDSYIFPSNMMTETEKEEIQVSEISSEGNAVVQNAENNGLKKIKEMEIANKSENLFRKICDELNATIPEGPNVEGKKEDENELNEEDIKLSDVVNKNIQTTMTNKRNQSQIINNKNPSLQISTSTNITKSIIPLKENQKNKDNRSDKNDKGVRSSMNTTATTDTELVLDNNTQCDPSIFYDKKRTPSYTDRVLYRSLPGMQENLTLLSYHSFEDVSSSDHKPVACAFSIKTTDGGENIVHHSGGDGAVFELFELKGFNLAEMDSLMGKAAGSDPYVVISADPESLLPTQVQSTTVIHDLNPIWPDEAIVIKLSSNDVKGMALHGHLRLAVWDWDRLSQDDLIGVCNISIGDIEEAIREGQKISKNIYYAFNLPIHCNGSVNGRLEGKIRLAASCDMETLEKLTLLNASENDLKQLKFPSKHHAMQGDCCSLA